MADPVDPLKFACPVCAKRYRVTPGQIEAAGGVVRPRCARCRAQVEVRSENGRLRVRLEEAPPEGFTGAGGETGDTVELLQVGPGAGTTLGRYRLERLLGRGGMGSVYQAYDPATNRQVALKVLPPGTPEIDVQRFEREIQVQGNVHHPHILPIFDSGEEREFRFYTMSLLRDPVPLSRLAVLVRSGDAQASARLRPLASLRSIVERVILPLCDAVHHANHKEGVLHRDITPTNVLVDEHDLRPYLIDFGVCTLLEAKNPNLADLPSEASLSLHGGKRTVSGTLVYMPPEQIQGRADRRGDVWGLGALVHHLVTGEPPVEPAAHSTVPLAARREGLRMLIEQAERTGSGAEAEGYRRKLEDLEAGRERTREQVALEVAKGVYRPRPTWIGAALDAVIAKAMAPDPELRYRNAKELRQDLEAWLAERPPAALAEQKGGTAHAIYASRQTLKRWRWPIVAAAVLMAGGAWFLTARERRRDEQHAAERAEARGALDRLEASGAVVGPTYEDALWRVVAHAPEDPDVRRRVAWTAERKAWEAWRAHAGEAAEAARKADEAGDEPRGRAARQRLDALLSGPLVAPPASPLVRRDGTDPGLPATWAAQVEGWREIVGDTRRVEVTGPGTEGGARLQAFPVRDDGGLGAGASLVAGVNRLTPGRYLLVVEREGRRVHTPFEVDRRWALVQQVKPDADALRLPPRCVYVRGGRLTGPRGEASVSALVWEAHEVTIGRYADWLATLPAEEQVRRVPREMGLLGAPSRPLWPREGGRFVPPRADLDHPVDAISLHDARAFAAAEGRRLPTADEWAWAASGPYGAACAVGGLARLDGAGACLGPAARVPRQVGACEADVSPFGLHDMAGNVAELTATLIPQGGLAGWAVMGSGYGLAPERARVTHLTVVPGWQPLPGVGFRLVMDP